MDAQPGHCWRCSATDGFVFPWRGFRWVKRIWYAGLLGLFVMAPIILSEITVLLPLALAFAFAAGPVHALAAQKATCRSCGAAA